MSNIADEINNGNIKNLLDVDWRSDICKEYLGEYIYYYDRVVSIVNDINGGALKVAVLKAILRQYLANKAAGNPTDTYFYKQTAQLMENMKDYAAFDVEAIMAGETIMSKKVYSLEKEVKQIKELLPPAPTEKEKIYIDRAIKKGYIEKAKDGYKWTYGATGNNTGRSRLAYFISKIYPTKEVPIDCKRWEALFCQKRLGSAINDTCNNKTDLEWKKKIDDLFND